MGTIEIAGFGIRKRTNCAFVVFAALLSRFVLSLYSSTAVTVGFYIVSYYQITKN